MTYLVGFLSLLGGQWSIDEPLYGSLSRIYFCDEGKTSRYQWEFLQQFCPKSW